MTETSVRVERRSYRFFVLAILILVYAFNFLDRQILSILKEPIAADLGITKDWQIGILGGIAFASVYSTLAIPLAWLSDRVNRTWVIGGSMAVWSAFTALCGTASSYWQLFAYRMGVGVGEAGGVAPSYSMVADYFPKSQRARALAAYSFGIPIGTACGILFGGLIAAKTDWRIAFLVVGLAGLALAPIFKFTVRDPPRGGLDGVGVRLGDQARAPTFGDTVKVLLPKRSFWLLGFGAAFSSMCGYGLAYWLPTYFERSLGLGLEARSWYYASVALLGGLFGIGLGGHLADRFGSRAKSAYPTVPAVCFLVALPCFVAATSIENLWLAFVLFLIPIGLNLAWLGPIITAIQHLVPATMRSTASAMFLLINNLLGIGVGLWYFGAASDFFRPQFGSDSMRWSIYSGMGFYLLAALLFLIAARTLKKDWVD